MKILKGKKRIVITVPSIGIVIKFPIIRILETLLVTLDCFENKNRKYFYIFIKGKVDSEGFPSFKGYIFGGILENWREFIFFHKTRNIFLQPTYFSLFGFVNIQKLGNQTLFGNNFSWNLREIIGDDFYDDPHHFANSVNFCVENNKLKILDYGSVKCQKVIAKHGERVNREFKITM